VLLEGAGQELHVWAEQISKFAAIRIAEITIAAVSHLGLKFINTSSLE
jgi:hypothetical protein